MGVARECSRSIAGAKLATHRNYEFKDTVGKVDYGLGESFVQLHFNKFAIGKLKPILVALLVLALNALVNFPAVCLEFDVAVLANKLKVNYGNPSFTLIYFYIFSKISQSNNNI